MAKFEMASKLIIDFLKLNASDNDFTHALSTREWLLRLEPNAGEILQLAALAHDIERARNDPVSKRDYFSYGDYKLAHAKASAEIVASLLKPTDYNEAELKHLGNLIRQAEFRSVDPEVQLLCDADSVSFFDKNVTDYLTHNGEDNTRNKMEFMYRRSSKKAQGYIKDRMNTKEGLPLFDEAHN